MRACPVCPYSEIPDASGTCPSCGTDLAPLNHMADLPAAYLHQSRRLLKMGRVSEAVSSLATAVALNPRLVEARKLYAKLLWNSGNYAWAVSEFAAAVQTAPDDAEAADLTRIAQQRLAHRHVVRVGVLVSVSLAGLILYIGPHRHGSASAPVDEDVITQSVVPVSQPIVPVPPLPVPVPPVVLDPGRTDEAWAALVRERDGLAESNRALNAASDSYRQTHSHTDAAVADQQKALDLYASTVAFAAEQLQLLRPSDADSIVGERATCKTALAACEAQSQRYDQRNDFVGWVKLHRLRRQHAELVTRLARCEQEYQARVVPWEQKTQALEAELQRLSRDAPRGPPP